MTHLQKFQLLLFQEFTILAGAMTTAKPDEVGSGITTVISDALHGSYFFLSAPTDNNAAQEENSETAVIVGADEGKLKKVTRRKRKKRERAKRNHRPSPGKLGKNAEPIGRDVVPVVVWDPLQMSPRENPPRQPRSAVVAAAEGPPAAASQLLIAVEETSPVEVAPRVPRLIDDDVELEQTEGKGTAMPFIPTPTPKPDLSVSSDGTAKIDESDPLDGLSNDPVPKSIANKVDQTKVLASPQAESPPTVEVAATIQVASEPEPREDPENNPLAPSPVSTKLPLNEEAEFGARNDTAAPSPALPSHLKVLNFNFKEGAVDDKTNAVENVDVGEEEKVLVVLPTEVGSVEEASSDLARPPFVLLASTAAPPTTTTTTTTDAPTLPPSSATPFAPPAVPAELLGLSKPTAAAAPGSVATTTLDPIRTGMKIIQSSTLFVPSPNPGKID